MSNVPRPDRTSRYIKDFFLAAGSSVLFLCVVEVALHLYGVRFDASLFQMDPVRDYSFRPDATGWLTTENDVFVHINAEGNRDQLRSPEPAPGTFRIAVLGSSTTAGLEVEQQQTYTALLEKKLSHPGAPVEVLNFAVEGYGPAQDFYTLENQVWRFHPKIVIDEVSLKQYVLNSTKKYSTTSIPYPYFKVTDTGVVPDPASEQAKRPTAHDIAESNRTRAVVNSFDLALLATEVRKRVTAKLKGLASSGAAVSDDPRADPWRWTLIPPPNPEIEQGWEVLDGLTLAMRDQAAAHGAEFWTIASDDAFQVNPDPKVAEELQRKMSAPNLDYGDHRYDSFLSAHHINHIHLEPALQAYVRRTGAYLHGGPKMPRGEGHWNVLGHEVVSQIVASDIETQSASFKQWQSSRTALERAGLQAADPVAGK